MQLIARYKAWLYKKNVLETPWMSKSHQNQQKTDRQTGKVVVIYFGTEPLKRRL